MSGSAISTPTYQAVNANIANDGSADSPRGWAIASDANYTFTSTGPSRVRCSGMTAARTVTLPTTGIKAGAEYEVIVSGATETNYVVLNSSGANEVDRIGGSGRILVVALQDTPTTAAHWAVVSISDVGSFVANFNLGMCTTTTNITISFTRADKVCTLFIAKTLVTATATTFYWECASGSIPARLRPQNDSMMPYSGFYDNNIGYTGCWAYMYVDGQISFRNTRVNNASTNWTSGTTNCGIFGCCISYRIA